MRRLLTAVLAVVVSAAMLGAGGCIKITRSPGRTEVRPGSIEVTRHNTPANNAPRYFYEGNNP